VGVKQANIIEPQPSVKEGIAEMSNIYMCHTSRIVNKPDAGATGYLVAISKHF
jgi:hypothetical protein